MNIQTAASYMKYGYRIRRASWGESEYLFDNRDFVTHAGLVNSGPGVKHLFHSDWMPEPIDLIADDWEVILVGITNNYGAVEYEDNQ